MKTNYCNPISRKENRSANNYITTRTNYIKKKRKKKRQFRDITIEAHSSTHNLKVQLKNFKR